MGVYRLEDCSGMLPDIGTDSALTPNIDSYSGQYIYTQQYPNTCWEVIKDAAPAFESLSILTSYTICQDCLDAVLERCGCPPGYTYNTATLLCESSTAVCPNGYTYDPITDLCVGTTTTCDLDLAIVVDRSSSIKSDEISDYRSFISALIDGIQDDGGENRITTDKVRVAIIYFGNSSPITAQSSIPLQIGTGTTWTTTGGTLKISIGNMAVTADGTNSFSGLRAAYTELKSGVNARPAADKRILFLTDGWPNRNDLNPDVAYDTVGTPYTFNNISPANINYSDGSCVTLGGLVGIGGTGVVTSICHNSGNTDALGVNTSTLVVNKRKSYTTTMDLAQDIKTGTANPPVTGDCTIPVPITLVIVGSTCDRTQTKLAFVGGTTTTPAGVIVAATGATDYCQFNVNTWKNCTDGVTTTNQYYSGSYEYYTMPSPGVYNWKRFPSNNAAGNPDFFETDFAYDPAIIAGINASLICTPTQIPAECNAPCVLNTVTGQCECSDGNVYVDCCYELVNCNNGTVYATVNTSNLVYDFLAQYVGSIIRFEGLDACLWVQTSDNCGSSTPIENLTNIEQFTTCEECQPCYILTNCNNGDVIINSNQDLSGVTGKVIELAGYPGLCWTVLKTFNCPGPFTTIAIVNTYDDCQCCFQYQCV
jgi:hypothetical protein